MFLISRSFVKKWRNIASGNRKILEEQSDASGFCLRRQVCPEQPGTENSLNQKA
jgi:hypothetical protein